MARKRSPRDSLRRSPTRSAPPSRLYAALEGWRGVCACLVALFHFRQLGYDDIAIRSHIGALPVVENAYLFVDFFFVLSGFVIAASYGERLMSRVVSLRDFLTLRLGRLYPLHLFTLGLMLAEEGYRYWFMTYTGARNGFVNWGNTIGSFAVNVAMLQGMHLLGMTTWNRPSWSISAEFATYVAFALLWAGFGRRSWVATVLLIIGLPFALFRLKGHIDATYDWGALRAVLGFALGVVVHHVTTREWWQRSRNRMPRAAETVIEVVLVSAVALFVGWVARRPASIAAPFLFALAVAVFAGERGLAGRALASRPMRALGRWSYSIYMLHFPVQQLLFWVIIHLYAAGWVQLVKEGGYALQIGRTAADGLNVLMLALVISASALAFRWVETPWRDRARARVAGRQPAAPKGR
jgi:peptidoglycan/LPS O-acetylase OafA/YrhL